MNIDKKKELRERYWKRGRGPSVRGGWTGQVREEIAARRRRWRRLANQVLILFYLGKQSQEFPKKIRQTCN